MVVIIVVKYVKDKFILEDIDFFYIIFKYVNINFKQKL